MAKEPMSERDAWIAELDYMGAKADKRTTSAQFVVRTACRAQAVARALNSNPMDELLEARDLVGTEAGRGVIDRAMEYLSADRKLGRELGYGHTGQAFGL